MTLTDFLRARMAEDAAVAQAAGRDGYGAIDWAGESGPTDVHIARHDPARVLVECEAKRRIVEEYTFDDGTPAREGENALLYLAAVYPDHPDYREEWRP